MCQCVSLSGNWNPPGQTRTNTELVHPEWVAQSTHFPTSSTCPKDGVGSGATTTQRSGRHFPGTTKQESRCEIAGCRGSQTICEAVIAFVFLAFCCSRAFFRSRMRWRRCLLVRKPRCGTIQSIDVSSISFTAQIRRRSLGGYWPLVRRGVILLDPRC